MMFYTDAEEPSNKELLKLQKSVFLTHEGSAL